MNQISSDKTPVNFFGLRSLINSRYTNFQKISCTYYGGVISAYDQILKRNVHIRIIENATNCNDSIKGDLNEISLLKHYQHENILQLYDIEFYKQNKEITMYIITEPMDTNLESIIRSPQVITNDHIQFIIYQAIRALFYIHSSGVIVGNLCPRVIEINANCEVKICNFRLAFGNNKIFWAENHVYRVNKLFLAPEYFCGANYITTKSDIWSIGCIMATLLRRQPLFDSESYLRLIASILEVLGSQEEDDFFFLSNQANEYIKNLPKTKKILWNEIFQGADPAALNFLDKMLVFNPLKRWCAEKLLKHKYLETLYDPEYDDIAAKSFLFDYHEETDRKNLKKKLYRLIENHCIWVN
ncbi:unnamed protein product [Blepharisma stoltei]|uniref:Protein kinase domain-containing protein n=1 Tax=Blepharisma stoltei TaxID=1481888 RepID=A0AAU9JHT0_9CILI|nr:unnamed protein product [Blepharisma stoltei]